MTEDLTDTELHGLLRDHLEQCLALVERIVATPPISSVVLHIEHALSHLEQDNERLS